MDPRALVLEIGKLELEVRGFVEKLKKSSGPRSAVDELNVEARKRVFTLQAKCEVEKINRSAKKYRNLISKC